MKRSWSAAMLCLLATLLVTDAARSPAFSLFSTPRSPSATLVPSRVAPQRESVHDSGNLRYSAQRADTLWIFDADFENPALENNQGWLALDESGTPPIPNYWHRDSLRVAGFAHLGDTTWWCGKYDACWLQPRGYGNDWTCDLWRDLPLSAWSSAGDTVTLEFDQRFAMELEYDYAYVDASLDSGASWTTLATFTNAGFPGTPGYSQDWDSPFGHQLLDLADCAGADARLRFRFQSDAAYSAQDQYPNPPMDSVVDGAWQIDNIEILVNGVRVWFDDCETSGDNGWTHGDTPGVGQAGVVFERGLYGLDFLSGGPFTCDEQSGWMYAALDEASGLVADGQAALLRSPPVDIEGCQTLVGRWFGWLDCPYESGDMVGLRLASGNEAECIYAEEGLIDYGQPLRGGPEWSVWTDDWSPFVGNSWLGIEWALRNVDPAHPGTHGTGFFLGRQQVGVVVGQPGTKMSYRRDDAFRDRFAHELDAALSDTAWVSMSQADGIVSATLVASSNGGSSWTRYPMLRKSPFENLWAAPAPSGEIAAGVEVLYYFECMNGSGGLATLPPDAPDTAYEFSILPINGGGPAPGVLVVDKRDASSPGERRDYAHDCDYYYREALEALGFTYDVYDVALPGAESKDGDGPDAVGLENYRTVIWATSNQSSTTLSETDLSALTDWLSGAEADSIRGLLLCGQNVGASLSAFVEGQVFLEERLGAAFVQDTLGSVLVDSVVSLVDSPGGWQFVAGEAAGAHVAGGCPELGRFDVLAPASGPNAGEEAVAYLLADSSTPAAGVARADSVAGARTVILGFGLESLAGPRTTGGYFESGLAARADLLASIMEYLGEAPGTTEVHESARSTPGLSAPFPNPCEGTVNIRYRADGTGRLTIRIYSVSGRLVRTLLESETSGRSAGLLSWNGADDSGEACACGVYFCRMESPCGESVRKLILIR